MIEMLQSAGPAYVLWQARRLRLCTLVRLLLKIYYSSMLLYLFRAPDLGELYRARLQHQGPQFKGRET